MRRFGHASLPLQSSTLSRASCLISTSRCVIPAYGSIKKYARRGRADCNAGEGDHPMYVNVDMDSGLLSNQWVDSLSAAFPAIQVLAGDVEEAMWVSQRQQNRQQWSLTVTITINKNYDKWKPQNWLKITMTNRNSVDDINDKRGKIVTLAITIYLILISWYFPQTQLQSRDSLFHLDEIRRLAGEIQLAIKSPRRLLLPSSTGTGGIHLLPISSHKKSFLPSRRKGNHRQFESAYENSLRLRYHSQRWELEVIDFLTVTFSTWT